MTVCIFILRWLRVGGHSDNEDKNTHKYTKGTTPKIMELVDGLPDESFTASSYFSRPTHIAIDIYCYPYRSRVSSLNLYQDNGSAWCALTDTNSSDYLQIEFIQSKQIKSVTIYGRWVHDGRHQWVTSYYFQYSVDGKTFINAYNADNNDTFTGNSNATYLKGFHSILKETITAKYIRIVPIMHHNWKSLRIELFGYDHPCQYKYGGNWLLVRHAYNNWHNATDNLAGIDVYGTFDNNPQSLNSWSIQFDNVLESDGSTLFMFSNGDCSEWMITRNDQFTLSQSDPNYGSIIASHFDIDYSALWWTRYNGSFQEDPWISWRDHGYDNWRTILYGENKNGARLTRFQHDPYVNVWIR